MSTDPPPALTTRDDKVLVRLRVQPRASRTELVGLVSGAFRVRLKAPPVDGKANAELLKWLGRKVLGVPPSSLELVSGRTGRDKVVAVTGLSIEEVRRALET